MFMSDLIKDLYPDEIVRYKKKKKKPSKKKSNHKHEYEPCLINWDGHISSGTRCKICGKIGEMKFFESEPCEDRPRLFRLLNQDEILEKYNGLKCYDYKTTEEIDM